MPALVQHWAEQRDFPLLSLPDPAEVHSIILRGFPAFLFVDADRTGEAGVALVRTLKSDAFTAIVPVVMLSGRHDPAQVESWFAILQKRILRHGVFDSVETLAERVAGFIEHWNSGRHPFRWKFKGYPLEARESAA